MLMSREPGVLGGPRASIPCLRSPRSRTPLWSGVKTRSRGLSAICSAIGVFGCRRRCQSTSPPAPPGIYQAAISGRSILNVTQRSRRAISVRKMAQQGLKLEQFHHDGEDAPPSENQPETCVDSFIVLAIVCRKALCLRRLRAGCPRARPVRGLTLDRGPGPESVRWRPPRARHGVGRKNAEHPQRDSNPCFRLERAMSSAAGRWGPGPKATATERRSKISGAGLHSGNAFARE